MRWLIRILGTLVLFAVLAVAALFLVPAERIAQLAADRFEAATGRALVIDGPVRATIWPRLGVRAQDVRVANAPWAGAEPFLQAAGLEVGVPLSVLTGGDLRLEVLELEGARLRLAIAEDGRGNWEFGAGAADGDGTGVGDPAADFAIDRAVLSAAEITFEDRRSGTAHRLRALDAEIAVPDPAGALTVTASALYGGQALAARARAARGAAFLRGALTELEIALQAGATELTLSGQADLDALAFDGRMRARSTDGLAPLTALGLAPPDLPAGLGGGRIALDAAVTLAPEGSLHLRDMVLDLDDNRLSGALDLYPGDPRPRFTARLSAPALDLTGLGGAGTEPARDRRRPGWGTDPIDASGLFAADGALMLELGPVALDGGRIDGVAARVTVQEGRAVATLDPLRAYGGRVTGDLVANGRGGFSARAELTGEGIALQNLLTDIAGIDRLVGTADARVDLLAVGDTPQALVESLDGSARVELGRGEVLGLDIVGMIRNLDPSYMGEGQKTVFDALTLAFDVTDGVARDAGLALDAPLLTASAEGTIDLGAQTLDYRLLPRLRAGGPVVPVLIDGPWDDPRVRLDLEYLARLRLEEERAELEARARAEADAARDRAAAQARDKLAAELEVEAEALTDTEALQDAIRDRVEDQLMDLLLGR